MEILWLFDTFAICPRGLEERLDGSRELVGGVEADEAEE